MKKIICIPLSLISLIYYLWLGVRNEFQLSVLTFWLLLFFLLLFIAFWDKIPLIRKTPRALVKAVKIGMAAGFLFFLSIEGMVMWGMGQTFPEETDLDYIIVLGGGLSGERPSHTLELRLERALAYIETHPDTKILAAGGVNPSASVSEAEAMKNWLLENGVDSDHILMEEQSTTTAENMQFGMPILMEDAGSGEYSVGIVTSDFHVFRSLRLAVHAVHENEDPETIIHLYGIAAEFPAVSLPHYMVREFFTICVDTLRGNMEIFPCILGVPVVN